MFVQKVPHIKDQFLTQERASMELESGQISVGWYTNEQDSQSVVHSHPYYELVLPLVGSNVRYSVDGNIYDINLGEMIIFPARCYHAGMFNITDKISERLIAQISAELRLRHKLRRRDEISEHRVLPVKVLPHLRQTILICPLPRGTLSVVRQEGQVKNL